MTPRERWLALFNGKKPDRLPTDYWATGEFTAKIQKALGCADIESLFRQLEIDGLCCVGPKNLAPQHPG